MGDKFSFNFKLHEHTADPIKVSNLVSSVLATLDNEIKLLGETSNGDVLQGLAMALAIRSKIIHGADDTTPLVSLWLTMRSKASITQKLMLPLLAMLKTGKRGNGK